MEKMEGYPRNYKEIKLLLESLKAGLELTLSEADIAKHTRIKTFWQIEQFERTNRL